MGYISGYISLIMGYISLVLGYNDNILVPIWVIDIITSTLYSVAKREYQFSRSRNMRRNGTALATAYAVPLYKCWLALQVASGVAP